MKNSTSILDGHTRYTGTTLPCSQRGIRATTTTNIMTANVY